MAQWDTILFDLDGTLIDTIDDLARATEQVLAEWGFGNADGSPVHNRDAYHQFVGNGIRKLLERAFGGKLSDDELDKAFARFIEVYDAHCADKTAPYDGIVPLLDKLKEHGYRMGVVTNKAEAQARRLAKKFFEPYGFCCVYGSAADRPNKPHPQVVQMALSDCGTVAERTLFVGDSNVDVETAHNAGLVCGGAVWGFRGEEELRRAGAEILLHQPLDLLQVLEI
ncbi:MAG: HAD family hydrolase [Clostridia bacterium]|nr:HAD family hydrolase [Clostridia bacterium]